MHADGSRTDDQRPAAAIATVDLLVDVLSQTDESAEGTEGRLSGVS